MWKLGALDEEQRESGWRGGATGTHSDDDARQRISFETAGPTLGPFPEVKASKHTLMQFKRVRIATHLLIYLSSNP